MKTNRWIRSVESKIDRPLPRPQLRHADLGWACQSSGICFSPSFCSPLAARHRGIPDLGAVHSHFLPHPQFHHALTRPFTHSLPPLPDRCNTSGWTRPTRNGSRTSRTTPDWASFSVTCLPSPRTTMRSECCEVSSMQSSRRLPNCLAGTLRPKPQRKRRVALLASSKSS